MEFLHRCVLLILEDTINTLGIVGETLTQFRGIKRVTDVAFPGSVAYMEMIADTAETLFNS